MWISQTRWITIPKIGSLASFCYALASHGPRCESALISRVRCDSIEFRNCFLRPIRSNVLGKSLLRPRYKQLFERYDNGAAELMFVTNHRRNDAHFEQVKNIPFLKVFHMDDLIQCLVGNIDGAMPRTPPISLNGINALLPADQADTEVATSIVFARLVDFIRYMESDPFDLLFNRNVRVAIIVTYTPKVCNTPIRVPSALSAYWPVALTTRINNGTAHVIHMPFKKEPLMDAISQFSHDNYPTYDFYSDAAYKAFGIPG